MCLACHYRVIADDPKAFVGLPEVKVGLLPGGGGTQRMPRLIGVTQSLPYLLEGGNIAAAEAKKLGLVHEVVPAGELIAAAKRWLMGSPVAVQPWDQKGYRVPGGVAFASAGTTQTFMGATALVAKKTLHNYPAPAAILSCVYEGTLLPIEKGLEVESKYFATLVTGPVARNLIRTMFVNKGNADKLSVRPADVPKSKVTKLGVLGAGMMGAGVAYVSALQGMEVILIDSTAEQAEKGKAYSAKLLAKDVEKGRRTQEQAEAVLARIKPTVDYAQLEGADLVIEAVFEHRGIKADVTAKAEAVIPKTAVFASNTSTLPITGLAKASKRPKNFIGIHFFSPVEKMPLVEIIVGKQTGDEAIARALDYVGQLQEDADRGQRQPRLLHQPLLRHLHRRRREDAGRRHRPAADRKRGQAGRHAGRSARGQRRSQPRARLQGHAAVARRPRRQVQGAGQLAGREALRRGPEAPRPQERRGFL